MGHCKLCGGKTKGSKVYCCPEHRRLYRREHQLTGARTERVFDFIVQYKSENDGNSPSIRDIMAHCAISSTSVVIYHLEKLERSERIERDYAGARSIRVRGGEWNWNE